MSATDKRPSGYTVGSLTVDPTSLAVVVRRELQKVSAVVNELAARSPQHLTAPPPDPRVGQVAWASAPWNPGSGEGSYVYGPSGWQPTGNTASSSGVTSFNGATGAVTYAEADTLATVTGRGASTATPLTLTGGTLSLTGAGANTVVFGNSGVAAPSFGSRSAGTKIVLNSALNTSSAEYAIGIEGSTIWQSVPTTNQRFVWYGGTTEAARLTGAGRLTLAGQLESQAATGTAPLVVASTTAVTNLNADLLDGQHASAFMGANYTAGFTGAASRATTSKLADVVTPRDFGAVGDGTADDTAAIQAALNTGRTVVLNGGFSFRVTAALTLAATRQAVLGHGARIITGAGTFNLFTIPSGYDGCSIRGLYVDASAATGGFVLWSNGADRATVEGLTVVNPWNFAFVQKANKFTIRDCWVNNVRGTVGVSWFGNSANRSDVLHLANLTISSGTANRATGVLWDGNCHTLQVQGLILVNCGYAVRVINSSGGPAPAFGMFDDLEIDFPSQHAVSLEAGSWYIFTPQTYIHGSTGGSGIHVVAGVPADSVILSGGKITSHARYGIENGTRVKETNVYFSGNALGDISWMSTCSAKKFQVDETAYFDLNGGSPALAYDSNDYRIYNRALNREALVINGVTTEYADTARKVFNQPVHLPQFTVAGLPNAADFGGAIVYVQNSASLKRLAVSDGGAWRWPDGTVVS